jgi:hypothetical protein
LTAASVCHQLSVLAVELRSVELHALRRAWAVASLSQRFLAAHPPAPAASLLHACAMLLQAAIPPDVVSVIPAHIPISLSRPSPPLASRAIAAAACAQGLAAIQRAPPVPEWLCPLAWPGARYGIPGARVE